MDAFLHQALTSSQEPHEPREFIRLISSVSRSTATQLGWNPAVKLVPGLGKPARSISAYEIVVQSIDEDEDVKTQIYRAEAVLPDLSADPISGRTGRVFKARLLEQSGGVVGDPVFFKDVWLDADYPDEVDSLKEVLEEFADEERKHFLNIIAYAPIIIEGRDYFMDDMDIAEAAGNWETPHSFLRINAGPIVNNTPTFDSEKHHLGNVSSYQGASSASRVRDHHHRPIHKVHTRFVYEEVSCPLYNIRSTRQLFLGLQNAVKGLEVLYRMGHVHGDVSPSNILFMGGQGKLLDLDYKI